MFSCISVCLCIHYRIHSGKYLKSWKSNLIFHQKDHICNPFHHCRYNHYFFGMKAYDNLYSDMIIIYSYIIYDIYDNYNTRPGSKISTCFYKW